MSNLITRGEFSMVLHPVADPGAGESGDRLPPYNLRKQLYSL